jgi:hypothetical protein
VRGRLQDARRLRFRLVIITVGPKQRPIRAQESQDLGGIHSGEEEIATVERM